MTEVENELRKAVNCLMEINLLYGDIEMTIEGRTGFDLADNSQLPASLTPEETIERVRALNLQIGRITGPWLS